MPEAVRRLSDAEWLAICAAAKLPPDADARAEIEACLFVEYPAFTYDAKRVAAGYRLGQRRLKLCTALADSYGRAPLPASRPSAWPRANETPADDIMEERDLYYIEQLRRRAFGLMMTSRAIRRAHKGHHNVQREMVISRLCGVFIDNFRANDLTVTVPPSGGPPGGPLIAFLLAAVRIVMPKPPDPEALRKAIQREREGRERVRQWVLDLRQRDNGNSKREK